MFRTSGLPFAGRPEYDTFWAPPGPARNNHLVLRLNEFPSEILLTSAAFRQFTFQRLEGNHFKQENES